MKKIWMLLSICLLFSACATQPKELDLQAAAQRVMESYEANAFVRADEDFVATNFGTPEYLEEAAVYYTKNGDGTEFGFFRLSDARYTADMEQALKDYLASERESVEALAALYPAEELQARLARFDGATVGAKGDTAYYFLTDPTIAKTVLGS